jgi:hypothetical protein
MKTGILFGIILGVFIARPCLFAVDVDNKELSRAKGSVVFENNKNLPPPSAWDSLDAIRSIGARLGTALKEERGKSFITVGDKKRYLLKEFLPGNYPPETLSADILELGSQAGVDNIRNLRLIIAGYLEAAYNYDRKYAEELAIYISLYNVLYRNKLDALAGRYSKQVVSQLKKNRMGLAQSFKEWPGRTQIIVPLYDKNGEALVEVAAVLEAEVVKEAEKERPGLTTSKESLAAKEQAAARKSSEEAQKKKENLGNLLKKTQEKEDDLGMRIQKAKEELETVYAELVRAQKDVVKNKFGQPIQGNEAAKKLEDDVRRRQDALRKMEADYQETQIARKNAADEFAEAESDAAKKLADVQRMGI